ncbi:MAG: ABC transporter ATP-binding protein [Planctomycetes bacterium]|nr:ABC transporter ATP-binding protein [Planctomycetota bacterium]
MNESNAPHLIELHNVSKFFGAFQALADVSLTVPPSITGLLGPNGAGKSTLIKVMLGLVAHSSGTGHILGFPLGTAFREIRGRVGYMPEDDCYIAGLSGVEMVRSVARLSGLPSVEALRRAHEILDFCGTEQERYRPVETYSTGMRQKLKFAQAIVHDPPLLILDEPTSGLDPRERQIMLARIRTLAEKHGKTVLISTHILPDVRATCDHVVIMANGQMRLSERLDVLNRPESPSYFVRVMGSSTAFVERIRGEGHAVVIEPDGGVTVRGLDENSCGTIWRWAEESNVGIRLMRPAVNSLEQIFVDVVRGARHADV